MSLCFCICDNVYLLDCQDQVVQRQRASPLKRQANKKENRKDKKHASFNEVDLN
jgi:hypothetical protein